MFRQLTYDISWDEATFINFFRFELHSDMEIFSYCVKSYLLNQAIRQAIQCNNKHFKTLPREALIGTITNTKDFCISHVISTINDHIKGYIHYHRTKGVALSKAYEGPKIAFYVFKFFE